MWETLCRGYSVNLQCEDSSCLPCGWSIAWFPQIFTFFNDTATTEIYTLCFLLQYGLTKTKINPLRLMQVSSEPWML